MRNLAILALLPLIAACSGGGGGQVYPLAPDEALSRLHNLDDAGFTATRRCGVPIAMVAEALDPATIKWTISADGLPPVAFTYHVEPAEKGQSRLFVALPRDPAGGEVYDGDKPSERPLVEQPLRAALDELAAAALEGRKFDPARIKTSVSDEVCVLQRQTSGSDRLHVGGRNPGAGAGNRPAPTVDAWGSPSQAGASNFGNPAVAALPAPAVDPGAAAPPPPPPPHNGGGPQPLIN